MLYPLYPGAPAVVVVKYVVVPKRSRGTGKIAVPRERLYRNSDRQKSQVILSSQAAIFPNRQPPAFPAVILSGAMRSRRIRFFSPVKFCAAVDKDYRASREDP